jgi:hypothetical protein
LRTVVVVVEVVVVVVVVVARGRQSNGTHAVTPSPIFHVAARKPCLPATNALTLIRKRPGAEPPYR